MVKVSYCIHFFATFLSPFSHIFRIIRPITTLHRKLGKQLFLKHSFECAFKTVQIVLEIKKFLANPLTLADVFVARLGTT